MTVEVDVDRFHEEGYLVFRGVFDKARIADYRRKLDEGAAFAGDLLTQPDFAELVVEPLFLDVARKLLGGRPTYFGFSSVSRATTAGTASWHRDNADRLDFTGPDWSGGPYTPIRFGLYMQDHRTLSGGLMIRPKTHRADSIGLKSLAYIDTEPGDVAVWNMRILHAGGGKRLRDDPARPIDLPEAKATPPEAFLPEPEGKRYAAFVSYGLGGDPHTERYIEYLATRKFMVDLWRMSRPCERARELLAGADLDYRDIWAELGDRPGIGAHVNHVEKAHLTGERTWTAVAASH